MPAITLLWDYTDHIVCNYNISLEISDNTLGENDSEIFIEREWYTIDDICRIWLATQNSRKYFEVIITRFEMLKNKRFD
jgi:hypothetical protein